jgi:hypothetical protein
MKRDQRASVLLVWMVLALVLACVASWAAILEMIAPAMAAEPDLHLTCAGAKSVPPESDDNDPVFFTSVSVYLNHGEPTSMSVSHTTISGKTYYRMDQYAVASVWRQSGMIAAWRGALIHNPARRMAGMVMEATPRLPTMYIEVSGSNGRLERTVTSVCVPTGETDEGD